MSLLFLVLLLMSTDVVYEHLHVAYVGQWFLVAFVAVSFLGQLVVVALSVPDSFVAFLAIAFLVQFVVCVRGAVLVSVPDSSRTAEESGILPIHEWFCVQADHK